MEEINKTRRIILNVNDEPFILETERVLTNEDKEYIRDMAEHFFSRDEWSDEDIDYRVTLTSYKIVELIVALSNDVKDLKFNIKNIDLELCVVD